MSYEAPTLDEFVTKFPEFVEEQSARINAALAEAALSVDTGWVESSYKPAILYLAAHILSRDIAAGEAIGGLGVIQSETIGRISTSYKVGGAGESTLTSTPYGVRYREYLGLNYGGPILI